MVQAVFSLELAWPAGFAGNSQKGTLPLPCLREAFVGRDSSSHPFWQIILFFLFFPPLPPTYLLAVPFEIWIDNFYSLQDVLFSRRTYWRARLGRNGKVQLGRRFCLQEIRQEQLCKDRTLIHPLASPIFAEFSPSIRRTAESQG